MKARISCTGKEIRKNMKLLFDDGTITLDREEIPAVLVRLQVSGAVVYDNATIDGLSGTNKKPIGYSDADITATMELLTDEYSTCYEKLNKLNQIYAAVDDLANPKVYTIFNSHCASRNIHRVYFSGLDSSETDQDDVIEVVLKFVEHEPEIVKKEISIITGADVSDIEKSRVEPLQALTLEAAVV